MECYLQLPESRYLKNMAHGNLLYLYYPKGVKRRIDVTLFAAVNPHTSAKLHAACPRPYEEDNSILVKVCECLHISEFFERANEFNRIYNHFDYFPLTYSALVNYTFCNNNTRSFFK